MTTFEEKLIEFTVSINLEQISDTIYDSSKAMVSLIDSSNKSNSDKISLFEEYLMGVDKGLSIGSKNNINGHDILIIRYIIDGIISKYKNKQILAEKAWEDLSDLLS